MELVETVDLSGVEVQATAFIFLEFIEVIKSIGKMKMVIVYEYVEDVWVHYEKNAD